MILIFVGQPAGLAAEPLFLEAAGATEAARSLAVMAGGKTELVLTLTAAEVVEPQLSADLSLVGGTLVAPFVKGARPELQRVGAAQAGVQQFRFSIGIPASEKPQKLALLLRVKAPSSDTWLPLPVVMLEASPVTWKQTLQQFASRIPCGRLAGGERVDQLFEKAEIEIPETPAGRPVKNPEVLVWFAEEGEDELRLPETPAPAIWLVFKKNIPGGIELHRFAPHGTQYQRLLLDEQALVSAETNPAAQALLERALGFAKALATGESDFDLSLP